VGLLFDWLLVLLLLSCLNGLVNRCLIVKTVVMLVRLPLEHCLWMAAMWVPWIVEQVLALEVALVVEQWCCSPSFWFQ
jgi:hypothetical protein